MVMGLIACCTVVAQENFRVSFDSKLTHEDAAAISLNGKMPTDAIPFQTKADGSFDLERAAGKKMKALSSAVVACDVISDKEEFVTFGISGDWYYTCYINGKKVLDLDKTGNQEGDFHVTNHLFTVKLKKGLNRVAIRIRRRGAASWYFAFARMPGNEYWPAGEAYRQKVYQYIFQNEPLKIMEKPYHFNLSSTGIRIGVVGNKPFIGILRLRSKGKVVETIWSQNAGKLIARDAHVFTCNGLKSDQEYTYDIFVFDPVTVKEKTISSGKFRTFPATMKEQIFFAVNDLQLGLKGRVDALRRFIQTPDGFQACAFYVSLGDFGHVMNNFRQVYFETGLNVMRHYGYTAPFVFVRGNHEYRGTEAARYTDYLGRPYDAFRVGDVFYIVLDTGENRPRVAKKGHPVLLTVTDQYFREQREWLKKVIASPECKTAKHRIVLAHIPPFEFERAFHAQQIKLLTGGVFYGKNPQCKIDLWLSGHTHSPYRYDPVSSSLIGAIPRKSAKKLALTEWDKKNICFPVYVGDGPRGAGDPKASLLRVKIDRTGIAVKQLTLDGKIMDYVTFAPGKPVRVHQTTFRPYTEND